MAQVAANNSAASCWSVIDDNVYNLTVWINSHPGGIGAILSLCGKDGTSAFKAQHENQSSPTARLASFKLGPLLAPLKGQAASQAGFWRETIFNFSYAGHGVMVGERYLIGHVNSGESSLRL
jgi:cytochrome b involved in lipid metabolism